MACDREEDAFRRWFASVRRLRAAASSASASSALSTARAEAPAARRAASVDEPERRRGPARALALVHQQVVHLLVVYLHEAQRDARLDARALRARAREDLLGGAGHESAVARRRLAPHVHERVRLAASRHAVGQDGAVRAAEHSLHHGHAHRVVNAPLRRVHGEHRVERERLGAVPRVLSDPNERFR